MTRYTYAIAALMLMLTAAPTLAVPIGTMSIEFTGMNLQYSGNTISDATSTAGGSGNPAQADPLTSADFKIDGTLVGSLTSDISLDVSIPDVVGLSNVLPATLVNTSGANPGYFDLLIGTGPSATQYIKLDTSSVTITYLNTSSTIQFIFGGAVVAVDSQNLPFGLVAGAPVTVSFSTKLDAGSKTTEGSFVNSFTASGTGAINALAVPEPAVCILAAMGLCATLLTRSRS